MQMPAFEKHVWAEIDLDALRHNFRAVKARAGEMPLCAVVKADSYGHGAVECAKVFAEEGAAWLAVSCLAEARQLRKAGLTLPILILGHVEPSRAPVLIQEDITAACYSLPRPGPSARPPVPSAGRSKSTSRPTPAWAASVLRSAPTLTQRWPRCWMPAACRVWT